MDNVFQYIFQLQNYQPMLTILTVLAAFLVGLYVFFIYRITFAGVIYSRTFNLSLVMLCMVTATVIMFMANNVKLSLGMVERPLMTEMKIMHRPMNTAAMMPAMK